MHTHEAEDEDGHPGSEDTKYKGNGAEDWGLINTDLPGYDQQGKNTINNLQRTAD